MISNENIHIAMSAIASYIYKRYGEEVSVNYVINRDEDFNPKCIKVYISEKDPEFPIEYEKLHLIRTEELISEGHAAHILQYYGVVDVDLTISIVQNQTELDRIPDAITEEFEKQRERFEEYGQLVHTGIRTFFGFYSMSENTSLDYELNWIDDKHIMMLKCVYKISLDTQISGEMKSNLVSNLSEFGEYLVEPSRFLRGISPNIIMRNEITYLTEED